MLARGPRAQLKNEKASFGKFWDEFCVVNLPGKGRAVIFERPFHVVDVTTERATTDAIKPVRMVEQRQILLDLRVPKIVPVTSVGSIEKSQKILKFAFGWDRFVMLTIFNAQPDALFGSIFSDSGQAFQNPSQVTYAGALATLNGGKLRTGKLFAEKFYLFD